KEFAVSACCRRALQYAGLIIASLFACIGACLQLMTDRRGLRLVKALKTAPLHLPPRIGAWCWQRKANRRRLRRRWKSSAEPTGGHFTGSLDAKVISRRKRKISLKLFLRGCSSGRISKLSGKKGDVCVLICWRRSRIFFPKRGIAK